MVLVVCEAVWWHHSDILDYQWGPGMECTFSDIIKFVIFALTQISILITAFIFQNVNGYQLKIISKNISKNKISHFLFSFVKISSQLKNVSF